MENELHQPKFKIGDCVEATWASGRTSTHIITGVDENKPHGTWYRFLNEDGFEVGLYGCFLRACRLPVEGGDKQ